MLPKKLFLTNCTILLNFKCTLRIVFHGRLRPVAAAAAVGTVVAAAADSVAADVASDAAADADAHAAEAAAAADFLASKIKKTNLYSLVTNRWREDCPSLSRLKPSPAKVT